MENYDLDGIATFIADDATFVKGENAVEIIASDDTQSAVTGLYGSEFVITSSTTPITDGQQVRLAGD